MDDDELDSFDASEFWLHDAAPRCTQHACGEPGFWAAHGRRGPP